MSITYSSLSDAVDKVMYGASPVLFADTCVLLDLVRLPFRVKQTTRVKDCLSSATSILDYVRSGNLFLVAPPPVYEEWNRNSEQVRDEAERHFSKLDEHLKVAQTIASHMGQSLPPIVTSSLGLPLKLYDLSKNLLELAVKLEDEDKLAPNILKRQTSFIPPARKGENPNDCKLYEHTLWVIKKLREHSFNYPIVFITSNTRDFCENNAIPKEPIKGELCDLNAKLITEWNWALHELNLMKP